MGVVLLSKFVAVGYRTIRTGSGDCRENIVLKGLSQLPASAVSSCHAI